MRIQKFTYFVAALLLVAAGAVAASAQVVTATGTVKLKQADGAVVPVKDAVVEIHRTDQKGDYKTKTDKKGAYVYSGIDFRGTYTILVSAPGARPDYLAGVKLDRKPENDFTLTPGDGSALTMEQIKAAGGATAAAAVNPATAAEAKKKAEEIEKERKKIEEQNAKATEYNTNVNTILKNANDAFNAKKYDEAISLYDQGTQAAPEEPVFHRNKATALNIRGVQKFIAASKLAAAERVAGKEEARKDFKAAIEESEKAVAMQKAKAASGDKTSTGDPSTALDLLNTRTESYRLASQTDTPVDPDVAIKAIEEYVAVETDATKKAEGQIVIGDVYFNSGRVAEAIAMYKQVLASNPNAINAMRGLGIALTVDPTGPKYAEARDLLQQFVDKAPENHPRRAETLDSVRYLDETMKTEASNKAEDAKKKSTKTRRP